MSLVEEIVAAHADRTSVRPGELLWVTVDRVYMQDGNTPTIRRLFAREGFDSVFDPERVGVLPSCMYTRCFPQKQR